MTQPRPADAADGSAGADGPRSPGPSAARGDSIWTVPNLLSLMRLALIPVFVWLLMVKQAELWAFWVLMVSGFSDWLDGKLARILDQSSKLGALLDPAADRLYIIIIPICFALRDFVPWWLIGLIVARDALLLASAPLLRSRGLVALPVLYIGKAATFALMSAFPWLLLGQLDSVVGTVCYPIGWAFMIWGVGLYLWSFVLYAYQTVLVLLRMPKVSRTATAPAD